MKQNKKQIKVKEGKLFSFALFKQSLKSQKTIWLATTLGNCLVVGIIIAILSTLTINTTRDGLSNLFDTASLEHTIKSSAAQAYMSYEMVTDEYYGDLDTLATVAPTIYDTDKQILSGYDTLCNETVTMPVVGTKMTYGKGILYLYDNSTGDTKADKRNATKASVSTLLNNVSGMDSMAKELITDYFLDPYLLRYDPEDGSSRVTDVSSLSIYAFPIATTKYVKEKMTDYASYADVLGNMVKESLIDYAPGNDSESRDEIAYNSCLDIIAEVLPEDTDIEMVKSAYNVIMDGAVDKYEINFKKDRNNGNYKTILGYTQSPSTFEENKKYLKAYAVISASSSMVSDLAKWEYFPTFEVKYVTNEAGVPIDKDGNEIYDTSKYTSLNADYVPVTASGAELKINDELLSKRVPVKENMGTNANNLQKKYRALLDPRMVEQLNGKTKDEYESEKDKEKVTTKYVGYLASEITKASNDLKEADMDSQATDLLVDFLKKTIKDDTENTNIYYDKTTKKINKDNMVDAISDYLGEQAVAIILEQFNVDNINDLTKENNGISGQEMLDKVSEYSSSAIATFDNYVKKYSKINRTDDKGNIIKDDDGNPIKKYSLSDCQEMAIVTSGIGITDQLPTYIKDSLSEMATMNTYGLVVGLIFFDCAGLLLPIIYLMMSANDLIAGQVDSGSLAFVLSTPTKRSKFTFTQVVYLFGSLIATFVLLFLVSIMVRHIGIALGSEDLKTDLTDMQLLYYSFGGFAVSFAIAGICFLSSCIFNKSKTSLGVGMGISMFFLVTSIIGIFGSAAMPSTIRIDAMNIFNYVTIVRLFDVNAILANDISTYFLKLIALFVIGIATTAGGCIYFEKKDLPL